MSDLEYYSNIILTDKSEFVKSSRELEVKFQTIADEIYNCPVRNSTMRSYDTVMSCVEKMVIEHALAQRTGFALNPLEFNVRDRHSYAYDVVDQSKDTHFECKRWAETWFSFDESAVSTFRKNVDIVDYLVCGKVYKLDDGYAVSFHLVADAKNFDRFIKPSNYSKKYYYDHVKACVAGYAYNKKHVNLF